MGLIVLFVVLVLLFGGGGSILGLHTITMEEGLACSC